MCGIGPLGSHGCSLAASSLWYQPFSTVPSAASITRYCTFSAKGNEESTDGDVIAGMYPDISAEPWAEYRVALKEGDYDTEALDYNSLGGMGTWAGYVGFAQIAETIKGDITAKSFFDAASATSKLDLKGMVPVLDFTKEWTDGLKGLRTTVQPKRHVQQA